jgi:hypothetical protein
MEPWGPFAPLPPRFAIVVAIVAIGTQNLGAHGTTLLDAIQVKHVGQQAGLLVSTVSQMHHGMARGGREFKLHNLVQRIGRIIHRPLWVVSVDQVR